MCKNVGVIGLGSMGMGMARTLSAKGFMVSAFDLSNIALEKASTLGINVENSASDVIAKSEVIVLSLPLAQHVEETIENGLDAKAFIETKIIIDTSTSTASVSRTLAKKLADLGHGFLDAPVSGGPQGAANGNLSIMLGGANEWVKKSQPVLNAIANKVIHVGESGAGNIAKLVNNMLVASHMLTTVEGLKLAQASGLSIEAALDVINNATGRSALSEIHFPKWVVTETYDSGFSAGLMRKDIGLALDLASETQCDLPVSELVGALWSEAKSGLKNDDDFMLMGNPQKATLNK